MIADEKVFAIIPPFEYEPPALDEVIAEHRSNFVALLLWFAASIGLALLAVNRMSVERS
jgi:hypothetical protein